ncbi:MAG: LysM peptidoglycan-binding domain-containing protein [Fibrobacterota bacterium]
MAVVRGVSSRGVYVLLLCTLSWGQQSSSQYDSAQSTVEKEMAIREQIAREQAEIRSLKSQITETENKILRTVSEQYEILGITSSGVDQTADHLQKFFQQLTPLQKLPLDSLYSRKMEIQSLADRFALLRSEPACRLSAFASILGTTDQILSDILAKVETAERAVLEREMAPKVQTDKLSTNSTKIKVTSVKSHTVRNADGERETLFKIAGYKEIYGNSSKWYRIYLANKAQIDSNYRKNRVSGKQGMIVQSYDYLTPGQVLIIPR